MVYLKDDYKQDKNKAQYIKNKLEYTLLRDVINDCNIYYDPANVNSQTNLDSDKDLVEVYNMFNDVEENDIDESIPWIIRFTFNKEIMMESGIVMEDINMAILNWAYISGDMDRIKYIYSDDNSKKELIGRLSIQGVNITESMNGLSDQSDVISSLKNISEELINNMIIKGIKNITNIVMSNIPYTQYINGTLHNSKQWLLETDGTNLLEILIDPYVDETSTISNDINEIYKLLGIEAARTMLIEEIDGVVKYEGEYINNRHIDLLCDTMTSKGYITSINRQGINREMLVL